MKCVIAGSRDITNYELVRDAFTLCDWSDRIDEIVSGEARGVDTLGERVSDEFGLKLARFPADWSKGRVAGHIRNEQMAKYCDMAIIVMKSGGSPGSNNMIKQMKKLKKPVIVYEVIGDTLCRIN